MKIEEVHWEDHITSSGWRSVSYDFAPAKVISVGTVVKENKKELVLGLTRSDDDEVTGTITILKSCITKRKKHGNTARR